jgi:hypothetical protein
VKAWRTDVAVVAGMLPGPRQQPITRIPLSSGNRAQWVAAQSRPLDWMKRIG